MWQSASLKYSFPDLEPVCWSMSSSDCCYSACIQISQETLQVGWYPHLLKNFPQFLMIHTVKGIGVVNNAEVDVSLELSCFSDDPTDVGNLISETFPKTILWNLSKAAAKAQLGKSELKYFNLFKYFSQVQVFHLHIWSNSVYFLFLGYPKRQLWIQS